MSSQRRRRSPQPYQKKIPAKNELFRIIFSLKIGERDLRICFLTLLPELGEVLICHWIPPVLGSVCWAITCPWVERPELLLVEADMVRPCGSCTGEGEESGLEVMEVT